MEVQTFKNKETGLVWDVSQEDLAERLADDSDFELVVDAPAPLPAPSPADKAAADKVAADKAAADKAAADKVAADADAAKKAQGA